MLRDDQVVALQSWLDAAKSVVGLSDWSIHAAAEPPDDEHAFAASFIRHTADAATVYLGAAFWPETPEERRVTLAHELVHMVLYRYHKATSDLIRKTLAPSARKAVGPMLESLAELSVERLALTIAPRLPIPEIPEP